MKKIAIIGYGKMGKLLESSAGKFGLEVAAIIDPALKNTISEETLQDADICIDFTTPEAAFTNIEMIAKLKKNIVIGTTGWFDRLPETENIVESENIGFVYGANFSVGMNIFFQIVEQSVRLLDNFSDYDIFGLEMHHRQKIDSPSGTAKNLAEIILQNCERKRKVNFDRIDRKISDEELHFASIRSGNLNGVHKIGFDSPADSIELKHTLKNRLGLVEGALLAANWIAGKKGFYKFSDIFSEIMLENQK